VAPERARFSGVAGSRTLERMRWSAAVGLLLAAGCGEAALGGQGDVCVRASQCEPGLACVAGTCSADLSGLEGGVVPSRDAGGMAMDAGAPLDAGPAPVDAGPTPDTGPAPMEDAGPTPVDSGPAPVDSGPAPTDSGPAPMDAGPAPVDSGPAPVDSGPDPVDAGATVDAGP
jgi:hypothetical protein